MRNIRMVVFTAMLFTVPAISTAQVTYDWELLQQEATIQVGDFIKLKGILTNTSAQAEDFTISLLHDDVPDDWTTSICVGSYCPAPFVREVTETFESGGSDTLAVNFQANSEGTGSIWLRFRSVTDPSVQDSVQFTCHATTNDVGESDIVEQPYNFRLDSIYPNPFNATTRITYTLPAAQPVEVGVYNIFGREVQRLVQGRQSAGTHQAVFNAGHKLPSGMYFVRLLAGGQTRIARAVLVK
ncbi:T9SS type A sorting domain-containing protein [bacterium]|nr:T9SS type A sorting domain-containing protein [bacterium]